MSNDELRSWERNSTLQLPKEESTSSYMSSEYMYVFIKLKGNSSIEKTRIKINKNWETLRSVDLQVYSGWLT